MHLTALTALTAITGEKVMRVAACSYMFVEFVLLIWGSVVVFGAWATWTYDESDAEEPTYCPYRPMMFAFVLLILKWVSYDVFYLQVLVPILNTIKFVVCNE